MPPDAPSFIGLQIDQYHVLSWLARGGMADVYLAEDINLRRQVVLKMMLPHLAQDQSFTARFQREARVTAGLTHPNIIQVYSAGFTTDGRPYLAMQYVRGGTLHDRLVELSAQRQLMSVTAVLTVIRQLSDALHTAHQAGIVHRDLKPSNILLHPNGMPVLTDLGIASVASATRLTHTGGIMGTPDYMSPEQAVGNNLDGRSDLYSLGVLLHELFTGAPPFHTQSPLAVLHQHIYEPPPPLEHLRPDLPSIVHDIVATCLQKEPGRRYQSAAQLTAVLDRALATVGHTFYLPETDTGKHTLYYETISRSGVVHPPVAYPENRRNSGQRKWVLAAIPVLFLLFIAWVGWQRPLTITSTTSTDTPRAIATRQETAVAPIVSDPTSTVRPLPTPSPTSSPTAAMTATAIPSATPIPPLSQIVFQSDRDGDYEIYIMDADGRNQQPLTDNTANDEFPKLSPDGRQIAFQSNRDGRPEIYIMNLDGSAPRRLTFDPGNDRLPTWSPTGDQIAFISDRDGDYDIYAMNTDGSNLQQITSEELYTGHMSWSINNEIVYNAGPNTGRWNIYVTDADGQNVRQLTDTRIDNWSPEWSPDGRTILFLSVVGNGDPAIFLMNSDGTGRRQLYNSEDYEWGAAWSADGQSIVFTRDRDDIGFIYMMNSDGSNVRLISEHASYPAWVP